MQCNLLFYFLTQKKNEKHLNVFLLFEENAKEREREKWVVFFYYFTIIVKWKALSVFFWPTLKFTCMYLYLMCASYINVARAFGCAI